MKRGCFGLLLLLTMAALPAKAGRPNVLIILTDDQGYNDVSAYGPSDARTPHIDRLAGEGMRFLNMRANCTVCSPSRAALLTGRYPDRVGVPGVIRTRREDSWGYLDPAVPTLADELRKAGYHTALIGKWHLGLEAPNLPKQRGFDLFHGFLGDMMDSYTTHLRHGINYMRHNSETVEPKGHATDVFTDWAVSYLRERVKNPERPFFLYLAYNAPHSPIQPPEEWLARVKARAPGLSEKRTKCVALIEHLDAGIGRVLDELDKTGLAPNTLVAFASDNGGALPEGNSNLPWRDGKQSHYDGGLRVPFIVRWPGVVASGAVCGEAGLSFDLFPTCLEAAGARVPDGLDALSLGAVLRGQKGPAARELYFVRREGGETYGGKSYEALIRGDWKVLQNDPYSPLELYNLKADPGETRNLAAENPQQLKELTSVLRRHIQRGGSVPWQAP